MFYGEVILTGIEVLKLFLACVIVIVLGLILLGLLGYVVQFGCYLYDKFFLFKKAVDKNPELSVKVLPLAAMNKKSVSLSPIVYAAVVFPPDGKRFYGLSHDDCYDKAFFSENRRSDTPDVSEGFMNSQGTFLSRERAMIVAKDLGQILLAEDMNETILASCMLEFAPLTKEWKPADG